MDTYLVTFVYTPSGSEFSEYHTIMVEYSNADNLFEYLYTHYTAGLIEDVTTHNISGMDIVNLG